MSPAATTRSLAATRRRLDVLRERAAKLPTPEAAVLEQVCAELDQLVDELSGQTLQEASERRSTEVAVQESEARLHALFDSANQAIMLIDHELRIQAFNRYAADNALAVYGTHMAAGQSVLDVIGPKDKAYVRELLVAALAGERGQFELPIDGLRGVEWWEFYLEPIRAGGVTTGLSFTARSINDRKSAELALQENEQRLRLAFDAARMGYWDWDLVSDTVSWSIEHNRITDLPLDRRSGSFEEVLARIHVDHRAAVKATVERSIREHEVFNVECRIDRRDGALGWVFFSGRPLFDKAGAPQRVIGVVRDITERRRAGEALHLLAEAGATLAGSLDYQTTLSRLSRLLVPTLADFCIIDLIDETEGLRRVEVAFADPSRAALAGEVSAMVDGDWAAAHADAVRCGESILVSDYDDAALHGFSADGERRENVRLSNVRSMIIVPLCVREQTIGAITLGAADNVRRYDEHDLELAQELARRAASAVDNARLYHEARAGVEARDAFLSIASHELKTPLTALLGYAYVLETADPAVPEGIERYHRAVDVIKRQSRRLNELIENMLDLSRFQQGQFTVARAPIDLAQLLRRVVDELRPTLTIHQLALTGVDEPLAIEGDEVRLEQVFHNLLGNAVKYSPRGGPLSVAVSRDGESVRVAVTDRGIGIPQAAMERLFTPFFRAGNIGDGFSGFGIGLYIVKQIVERHDGTIDVSSREGIGSTFAVTLPLAAML